MGTNQNNPLNATPVYVATGGSPLGYQQIAGLAAATALTVPEGASIARIVAKTKGVRWRDDDTDPTATVGMPLEVDTVLTYTGDLSAIKFIQQSATAELNVAYYG